MAFSRSSPLGAASLGEGPARAWLAHRYSVSYRQSKVFQQGAFNDTLEVAAPWARLAQVYDAVRRSASAHALVLAEIDLVRETDFGRRVGAQDQDLSVMLAAGRLDDVGDDGEFFALLGEGVHQQPVERRVDYQ